MTEKLKTIRDKARTGHIKIGKNVKIGLPGSDSYKAPTPRKLKNAGEVLVFTGSAVAIIAGTLTLPGWVIMVGGLSTLTGRFFIKMFSNNN